MRATAARWSAVLAALLLAPASARANDGFAGLSVTGLTFGKTDAVVMEREELSVSPTRVTVDYVFRNASKTKVEATVAFPLPPLRLADVVEGVLPAAAERPDFRVVVDGREVAPSLDVVAVVEPDEPPARPGALYDSPGRDVTALLVRHRVPLSLDVEAVRTALLALPGPVRSDFANQRLATFDDSGDGVSREDTGGYPQWSLVLRYHWPQTFPPGAEVRIHHEYRPRLPGGVFFWPPAEAEDEVTKARRARFCVDARTERVFRATRQAMGYELQYVLRTANSWAGPIGVFRLTVDKGAPKNLVSLCADGLKNTGPRTFTLERRRYRPERDLEVLFVVPATPDE